jgi:hypothetical protein
MIRSAGSGKKSGRKAEEFSAASDFPVKLPLRPASEKLTTEKLSRNKLSATLWQTIWLSKIVPGKRKEFNCSNARSRVDGSAMRIFSPAIRWKIWNRSRAHWPKP